MKNIFKRFILAFSLLIFSSSIFGMQDVAQPLIAAQPSDTIYEPKSQSEFDDLNVLAVTLLEMKFESLADFFIR